MLSLLANGGFEEGRAGEQPPSWRFGARGEYTAVTVSELCNQGKQCAVVRSRAGALAPDSRGFLYQIVNARPHRGKKFVFRAAVRTDVSGPPNAARLLVRVHREDGSSSFFDNMERHPITSGQWSYYEVSGIIGSDARDIELGMQLVGEGKAWLDTASLTGSQ